MGNLSMTVRYILSEKIYLEVWFLHNVAQFFCKLYKYKCILDLCSERYKPLNCRSNDVPR